MSDSFNAQEILNRLRKGTSSISRSNESFSRESPRKIHSSSNSVTSSPSRASNTIVKAPQVPMSINLTPAQRQDNLNVRIELEKDIKHLQDEVNSLKEENRQLKADKIGVEKQLCELKMKSDDIIVKLRGKIASMTLQLQSSTGGQSERGNGPGKMYPQPADKPPFLKQSLATQFSHFPGSSSNPPPPPLEDEGFRGPTFSELMRRSSYDPTKFEHSLRKQKKGTTDKNRKNKKQNDYDPNNNSFSNYEESPTRPTYEQNQPQNYQRSPSIWSEGFQQTQYQNPPENDPYSMGGRRNSGWGDPALNDPAGSGQDPYRNTGRARDVDQYQQQRYNQQRGGQVNMGAAGTRFNPQLDQDSADIPVVEFDLR